MSTIRGQHRLDHDPHGERGAEVRCCCGWRFHHVRAKVRDKAAARHLAKTGAMPEADLPVPGAAGEEER